VLFVSQAEISLLGEVNRIGDTVDNYRSCGVKIVGFVSFDLKPDLCVVLHQNDSYHHPMEDREPCPHLSEGEEGNTMHDGRTVAVDGGAE
jgi:hypothetical protein